MQQSFWWWQCSDRYIISLSPHLHIPFPPFSPSLISCTVSVDIKHQVYLYYLPLWTFTCLHLVHYTLLLTPTCRKSNNTNARLMAFAPSLALDPTFGIHSHKTSDTAQLCHLLKPNWKPSSSHSIFAPTNISIQFLLEYACMMYDTDQCHTHLNSLWFLCLCVCICVCVVVGGGGGVFPYGALCGLFCWDCALRVYGISYLG